MPTDTTETQLIAKATSGDRAALEELLVAHCTPLSRHMASKVPSSLKGVLSVDDVMQQTLFEAFRSIERFKPRTPNSFSVWLRTIAECQLQNMVKALTRKKRGGEYCHVGAVADTASSLMEMVEMLSDRGRRPSQSAMRREAIQAVQVGIASLPDEQRKAISLRFLQGKNLDETATQMGRTPGAVRSLMRRRRRLMEQLRQAREVYEAAVGPSSANRRSEAREAERAAA